MTALVTKHLPLVASAPDGIKKLRELVLELAVRGKLASQERKDEAANLLLKRVAAEKDVLAKLGKIKKQKHPVKAVQTGPFELPASWLWIRLGDIAAKITDGTHHSPTNTATGDFKYISAKNIKPWGIDLSEVTYVTAEVHEEIFARCDPTMGDVLYIKDGATTGIATINTMDEPFSMLSSVALLKPSCGILNAYLLKAMTAPLFYREMRAGMTGVAITRVTLAKLNEALIPLPPLAEQHRIVAKVDELMALCDRLEADQADAEAAHAQLVQALLDSLTQATDAADFRASWQRLSDHFHTLFTTEASIDALKQTVLQLAVTGRLVPQEKSEASAVQLLEEIKRTQAALVEAEGLRTSAQVDVPSAEQYVELPDGWSFYRLGNLAKFIDYRGRTPVKTTEGIPLITAKNVRRGFVSREPAEFIAATEYAEWMTRGIPRVGDILFTTEAPLGNVALIDIGERFALAQRVICFQLHLLNTGPYLRVALMSQVVQEQIAKLATGMTATGVKSSKLKELPLPIPPLAEQHRIVAKVDELMALCNQLKSQLAEANLQHKEIASVLAERALA